MAQTEERLPALRRSQAESVEARRSRRVWRRGGGEGWGGCLSAAVAAAAAARDSSPLAADADCCETPARSSISLAALLRAAASS